MMITVTSDTAESIIMALKEAEQALMDFSPLTNANLGQIAARCVVARTYLECAIEREAENHARH